MPRAARQAIQYSDRTRHGSRLVSRMLGIKNLPSSRTFSTSLIRRVRQSEFTTADRDAQRRAQIREIEHRLANEGLSDDELESMLQRRQQILNELAKERPVTYWLSVMLRFARASAVWVVPPLALLLLMWPTERKKEKWED